MPASRGELLVNAAQAPLLTPGGDTAGTMILLEDITERIRLEEQLQLSERMASVGLLAAGVAHEVNTPLTGISSFTQMLIEGTAPEDSRLQLLKKIERQVSRAARIVNGLLSLSRPGRQSDVAGPVDVNGGDERRAGPRRASAPDVQHPDPARSVTDPDRRAGGGGASCSRCS